MGGSRLIYEDNIDNKKAQRQKYGQKIENIKQYSLHNQSKIITFSVCAVNTHHKEHLPLVLVWQQEQTEDSGVQNLVVKCLTVEVKESRVNANIISDKEK